MRKRTAIGLVFILTGVFIFGCAPGPNLQTGWEYYPPDKHYVVYGQVTNFMHQPVTGCKVVLIRRHPRTAPAMGEAAEGEGRDVEFLVATTAQTGDYSFKFEPWGAYDVWLYFDALHQGYVPQVVQLNHYMRSLIARGTGRSPISVNIVLEPIRDEKTRKLVTTTE